MTTDPSDEYRRLSTEYLAILIGIANNQIVSSELVQALLGGNAKDLFKSLDMSDSQAAKLLDIAASRIASEKWQAERSNVAKEEAPSKASTLISPPTPGASQQARSYPSSQEFDSKDRNIRDQGISDGWEPEGDLGSYYKWDEYFQRITGGRVGIAGMFASTLGLLFLFALLFVLWPVEKSRLTPEQKILLQNGPSASTPQSIEPKAVASNEEPVLPLEVDWKAKLDSVVVAFRENRLADVSELLQKSLSDDELSESNPLTAEFELLGIALNLKQKASLSNRQIQTLIGFALADASLKHEILLAQWIVQSKKQEHDVARRFLGGGTPGSLKYLQWIDVRDGVPNMFATEVVPEDFANVEAVAQDFFAALGLYRDSRFELCQEKLALVGGKLELLQTRTWLDPVQSIVVEGATASLQDATRVLSTRTADDILQKLAPPKTTKP